MQRQTTEIAVMVSYPTLDCVTPPLNIHCIGFVRHSRAKRARLDTDNAMVAKVQSEYQYLQQDIASTSLSVETMAGRVVSEVR
jgi:hypothetical protein